MEKENEMILILKEKMEKNYKNKEMKRGAHPKTLGLLKANFIILDDIPEDFKIGLLKKPKIYKSWLRISNASGNINSDKKKISEALL